MGQLHLMKIDEPIDEWIAAHEQDDDTEIQETIRQLKLSQRVRAFARETLHLPVGEAYLSYADIGRDFVVWNVFAAEELSTDAHTWCYPVIGCAQYRGYFDKDEAAAYARTLENRGLETHIGGVQAYSTLGWFNDPVLNTFLNRSDVQLAALLFHELAHRLGYAKGDTEFNESFATVIERFGVSIWLLADDGGNGQEAYARYLKRSAANETFTQLVLAKRNALTSLYANTSLNDQQKLLQKYSLFQELRVELKHLDDSYANLTRYSVWSETLSNAKLVPVNSYNRWVDAIDHQLQKELAAAACTHAQFFQQVDQCRTGLENFYKRLKKLIKANPEQRLSTLQGWQLAYEASKAPISVPTKLD